MVSLYAVQWSSISLSPSVNLDRSFKLSQQRFAVRLEGKSRISVCLGLGRAAAGSAGISEKSGLGATSKEVIELERKVVVQTYARAPLVLVRGKGCKVYDAEGQEYLDMGAGIAVNSMGHGDPDLLKAIGEATELIHVSNVYYTIPQVELGKCLVECSFADRVFFSNSGTEANEAAIKFSRKFQRFYWPDVKLPAMEFIAFTNSFHGRTMGSLALTSKKNYRSPFEPVMPGVTFIEYGNIEMARNAIQPGKTAAVFVEPVQGEGGIYCARKEFLQALRSACDDAGALLIFDEAAEECTSVLELDHNHTGALMLRAQTLVTLKEYQSALFDVNRLMELNPSSDVYLNLQSRLKTQLALTPIPESEEEALAAELEEEEEEIEAVLEETVEAELEDEEVEGEAEEVAIVAEVDKNKKIMSPGNNPELLVDRTSEDLSDMHPQGWEAVPKPKGHSRLDYSRWDKVEDDSSEEEDEVEDSQPQYRFRLKTVGVRPVK